MCPHTLKSEPAHFLLVRPSLSVLCIALRLPPKRPGACTVRGTANFKNDQVNREARDAFPHELGTLPIPHGLLPFDGTFLTIAVAVHYCVRRKVCEGRAGSSGLREGRSSCRNRC